MSEERKSYSILITLENETLEQFNVIRESIKAKLGVSLIGKQLLLHLLNEEYKRILSEEGSA